MFIICRECGSANPASNKECRNCGMPLGEGGSDFRTGAPTPSARPPTETQGSRTLPAATPPPTPTPPPSSSAGISTGRSVPEESIQITTISYTTKTRAATEAPVGVAFYFPYPLVAERPSQVQVQIKNLTSKPIEQVEINVASRGLADSPAESYPLLPAQEMLRFTIPLLPAGPGQYVLRCTIKLQSAGQCKNFIAARILWINAAPCADQPLTAAQVKVNRGETGITLKELLADASVAPQPALAGPFSQAEELEAARLPELFESMDLALDYQLSLSVVEDFRQRPELYIPRLFVTNSQVGTKLKLTPANPEATLGIHLVALPQFKIGRSRMDSDHVSWFWPRGTANDERTRHLSRVHSLMERRDNKLFICDGGSVGGSNFDGQPLAREKWEPLTRRATLVLAGEYFLDVQPEKAAYPEELVIKNIKLWNGNAEAATPLLRGAVHFTPLNTERAHHHAVWLFTDAAFGSSRLNAIALEDQGLAEIQGRFHYQYGAFWLENCAKNEFVRVNYYILKPNEIAPLINGQLVQIGNTNYHVEVLA